MALNADFYLHTSAQYGSGILSIVVWPEGRHDYIPDLTIVTAYE